MNTYTTIRKWGSKTKTMQGCPLQPAANIKIALIWTT